MAVLSHWLVKLSQHITGRFLRLFGWADVRRRLSSPGLKSSSKSASSGATPRLPLAAYATVVIPALNEATRIASVVAYALQDRATAEVIVIDDSSIDATAALAREAGARVVTSSMLGKGASMADGVAVAGCDVIVYLDGDLAGLRPGIIAGLCAPLLRGEADFVKARFGRSGGRVTELTAKPMLQIFFPEIAHIKQPLGGIIAARRSLLQSLSFEDGYGVDVGLLLDAHLARARIAEVDIGSLEHDSQPLHDLAYMANEVGRVIFSRARLAGRLHVDQITAMYETQRLAASGLDYILTRRKGRRRLLLLCMGDTISATDFNLELARLSGQEAALHQLMSEEPQLPEQAKYGIPAQPPSNPFNTTGHSGLLARQERIANLFRFVPKQQFERVARDLPIRPGVILLVNQMRRQGFMVGVMSDGYFVAADIIRRRIFADFAMAHTIQFDGEVCTGQLRVNPAFLPESASASAIPCKSHVLSRFLSDTTPPAIQTTWVVGYDSGDLPLMRLADRAFAVVPKSRALFHEPGVTHLDSVTELLALLPNHELVHDLQTPPVAATQAAAATIVSGITSVAAVSA